MATSFIDLTNKLLRRLNEVQITLSDFGSVRGVQAMAKDAIVSAVESINQREYEWPFNAEVGTQELVVGQTEYDFPVDLRSVKWDAYHIAKDPTLGVGSTRLKFVSRNYWEDYFKDEDLNAVPDGRNVPDMVFEKHGFGFGVSPLPDKTYTVKYEYFKLSPTLAIATDASTIPTVYDEAIIQGGLYHFYMFRDNAQQAQMAEQRFKREVDDMRSVLINKEDSIRSTVLHKRSYGVPTGHMY